MLFKELIMASKSLHKRRICFYCDLEEKKNNACHVFKVTNTTIASRTGNVHFLKRIYLL